MRLVNVEALKKKLGMEEKEVIAYEELLGACRSIGVAKSRDEAVAFAQVLDQAGVILLFRDKVYLHPDKVSLILGIHMCLSYPDDIVKLAVAGSRLLCLQYVRCQNVAL